MRMSDFMPKGKMTDKDSLIGFDEYGNLIRIKISDLKDVLGVKTVAAEKVQVQYSLDANTWHTPFSEGDRYMRVKCGSGAWSDAIRISVSAYETWRDANGGKGTVEEFLLSIRGEAGASVDVSKLQISEMDGYGELVTLVSESITKALADLTGTLDKKLEAIEKRLSELEKVS